MESLKVLSKFLILIAFSIIAIACLYSVVIQRHKKNDLMDQSTNNNSKNRHINQYISLFFNNRLCVYGVRLIIIITACFLLFQNLASYYEIFKSSDYVDFKAFYLASKMSIEGANPYNLAEYTKNFTFPFLYPPNIIPLILPLALFDYSTSARIFFAFNLINVFLLIAGVLTLLKDKSRKSQVTLIVFCLFNFGIFHTLRMGQLTVVLSVGIIWAFIFARKNKNVLAGFLLGLVSIKPTLVILLLAYFLLKKRFLLIVTCLITSLMFSLAGLLIVQSSVTDFLMMYKSGYDLAFSIVWNSPFTSPTRIDAEVIGARLFGDNKSFAKLASIGLQMIPIGFSFLYFYKQQVLSSWSKRIYLSDVSLITCVSIFAFYSQSYSTTNIILVIPFLLNYLSSETLNKYTSKVRILAWSLSIFCLTILSPLSYMMLNYIVVIPSLALLTLTISIYILIDEKFAINKYQRI